MSLVTVTRMPLPTPRGELSARLARILGGASFPATPLTDHPKTAAAADAGGPSVGHAVLRRHYKLVRSPVDD
jgi:hypothetical protein